MSESAVETYRDLDVWKRGMRIVSAVYRITSGFPESETYGLSAQLRRAVVSIPSNIAEGWGRKSVRHYTHHLRMARSSVFEIETQIMIALCLGYIEKGIGRSVLKDTDVQSRMLMSLIQSLES